jgi:hypothetical protein
MARGEDTRHHPNRRVGRSDLPRLSEALANHLNDSLEGMKEDYEDSDTVEDEFVMSHSMPSLIRKPFTGDNSYTQPFSEGDASSALQAYRQRRDSGKMDSDDKELYGHDINEAYRNRG